MFQKPVSELTYEDIEVLASSGEPESILLDYKKMVAGPERDRAEPAKDVCAFANSQEGYLVIGIEERRGKPVHPPCGTESMIERQRELDERIKATIPDLEKAIYGSGVCYEKVMYAGAAHAFYNDTGVNYHPEAAKDAWSRTLAHFTQHL